MISYSSAWFGNEKIDEERKRTKKEGKSEIDICIYIHRDTEKESEIEKMMDSLKI